MLLVLNKPFAAAALKASGAVWGKL
jgi:hypothetical protein